MKKFCAGIFLTVAIIFCSQIQAEAYNYDLGIYPESGLRGYLMTETIKIRGRGSFDCTVVCYPSGRDYYIDYYFYLGKGYIFSNSDGYKQRVSAYDTPIEYNVLRYVQSNYRL